MFFSWYVSRSSAFRWLVVFLAVVAIYLPTANFGPFFFVDAAGVFHPAWHLIHHGHLYVDDGSLRMFAFVEGRGGHLYSNRTPGLVAIAIPFYLIFVGGTVAPSGIPAAIAAATICAAAVATTALVLEHILPRRSALAGALLVAFGTSLWSVASSELFAHGPDCLWLMLALLALLRARYWLSGLAFAAAITTRPQLAVAALILGLAAGWSHRRLLPTVAIGVPAIAGLLAFMSYNRYIFGGFNLQGGYESYVNAPLKGELRGGWWDYAANVLGTFLSGPRGLLLLSPVLIVLLPGLRPAWRASPWWVRAAALSGAAYMLIQWQTQSGREGFLGGYLFYSYRYSIEPLILCVPLLAISYREWASRTQLSRVLFNFAALFSVWIQGVGAIFYNLDLETRFHPWLAWSPLATLEAAQPTAVWVATLALAPVLVIPVCLSALENRFSLRGVDSSGSRHGPEERP